jgi:ADP-ribose pyrophosphatase
LTTKLKPWFHSQPELIADMEIFRVRRIQSRSPRTGECRSFSVLEAGDWVNVVALTPESEVVLVRQFRHGTRDFTIEIPGGMIDREETPARAASRELREESGYAGEEPVLLGVVTPNPAFLNNRCHTYLIENCRRIGELDLDHGEDIEVLLHPVHEIPGIIADGGIHHALVICAFWWLAQRQFRGGATQLKNLLPLL